MTFPHSFFAAGHAYSTFAHHVPAPALRHAFHLPRKPAQARLVIGATGFFRLFVNGEERTGTLLAPYVANPDDIVPYLAYDLTPDLQEGENVIGLLLGNGFANAPGGATWDFDEAPFRAAPAVALSFEADGLTFDASVFRTAPSPIWFDDLRCGCFYDARREADGWCAPGFTETGWAPLIPVPAPKGEGHLVNIDPIRVVAELAPVAVEKNARMAPEHYPEECLGRLVEKLDMPTAEPPMSLTGGVCFDFGKNEAGIPRLRLKNTTPGQRVEMQFCEIRLPDGALTILGNIGRYYPRGYFQRDIYLCRGGAEEEWTPSFTYHGCRYAYVTGLREDQIGSDTLTLLVAHTDLRRIGDFSCSDAALTAVHRMAEASLLSNYHHFPVDCPQREKNGWTGDAALSAEHTLLLFDAARNMREWLRHIRAAQREDGALPGIVPTSGWGFAWGNGPGWDQVLIEFPYRLYTLRGDRAAVEENADAMERYLRYAATRRDERGLLAYGLEDWCVCDAVNPKTPLTVTDTLLILGAARKAAFLFSEIGRTTAAAFAEGLADGLRTAFRTHLVTWETATVAGGTQAGQNMALYYGIFTAEEFPRAYAVLREIITRQGEHMSGGCLGMRTLFELLGEQGDAPLAYRMLTNPTHPSYGRLAADGHTTLPEVIAGWDRLLSPVSTPSLNHHFFGFVSDFFLHTLAGIRPNPTGKDPAHVILAPALDVPLTYAEGRYETVAGEVRLRWERLPAVSPTSAAESAATAEPNPTKAENAAAPAAGIPISAEPHALLSDTVCLTVTAAPGVYGSLRLPPDWHFTDGSGEMPLADGTFFASRRA